MDYDAENFNGEIVPMLSTSFKIPFKSPPATNPIEIGNEATCTSPNVAEETEVFSSPLLFANEPLNYSAAPSASVLPDSNETNCDVDRNSRKRTLTPSAPVTVKIYGRDPSYPDGLNELIQPLYCNLCDIRHNSINRAAVHYESKSHDKKITSWLNEWARTTGETLPKVRKFIKEGVTGPDAYHCQACDLPLTSLQHASQHYNGKRHKMVVANLSSPAGSGYYDNTGKWIRTPTKIKTDSRYGIGESFVPSVEEIVPKEKKADISLHCEVCSISVTSDQQMEMHLKGSKHGKKLKALGKPPYAATEDTVLASVQVAPKNDISMYRTPTGNYYCKTCNLTVTDPSDLTQHLNSKRHAKNSKKPVENLPKSVPNGK